jgi:hypothetical protein
VIAWLPGAWQRHTPTPARWDACRLRHSAIASSIWSFQAPGDSPKGETMFFSQVSEPAARENQFEIGVLRGVLPMAGAIECFESDTHFRGLSRSANRIYLQSSRCWDRRDAW